MNKISRRQYLKGSAAITGGLAISSIATAQTIMSYNENPTADNPIRCGSNENMYGPSLKAQAAMDVAKSRAHLYGMPGIAPLKKIISNIENIPVSHISVACGSSPFLEKATFMAKIDGGAILAPYPTYGTVLETAASIGAEVISVPVDENMHINLDAMRAAMTDNVKMIYLCNPNNPIPTIIEKNKLKNFCIEMSKRAVVIVDEAYYEYADDPDYETMAPLVNEHKNIVVCRTASKIHAMAGIRVGFAFAHPDNLKLLEPSFNLTMNYMALKGAAVSYQDTEYQNFIRQKNKQSLDILYKMFKELGRNYIKSNSNFTYFHAGHKAGDVKKRLLPFGIISGREFQPYSDWVRLSTVKPKEMQYVADVYKREFG